MGVPTLWAVLQALVACASAAQALSAGGGSPTPSPVWLTGDDETGCLARYDFVDAKFLGGGKPMFKTEGAPPPCSRSGQAWLVHLGGEWQVVTGNVLAGMVREHLGVRSDAALPSQVKGAWSQYRRGQLLGKTGVYARDHAGAGGAAREHRLPVAAQLSGRVRWQDRPANQDRSAKQRRAIHAMRAIGAGGAGVAAEALLDGSKGAATAHATLLVPAVLLCVLWFALGKRARDRYFFKRSAPTGSGWSASDEAMLAA
jgi:hypothetical protein